MINNPKSDLSSTTKWD